MITLLDRKYFIPSHLFYGSTFYTLLPLRILCAPVSFSVVWGDLKPDSNDPSAYQ